MLPVRLELKNFLAYRDAVVQFDGLHVAALTGPNGAGKSSLLDAITWALWGKARSNSRADELVHVGQSDMWVQLDFKHENQSYRVLRRRTRKGAGGSQLDLFAWTDDAAWNPISEPTLRATDAKISQLLRLDYDTFTHSALLQQGKADSFISLQPAQRKDVLAEILGLKRFEAYEKAARERMRKAETELYALKGQLETIEAELSREPELRAALRAAQEEHDAARTALEEADTLLREVEYVPRALQDANREVAQIEQRLSNARRALDDALRRVGETQAELKAQEKALADKDKVEAGYRELQQARSENQALGEKFEQFSHLRDKIRGLEQEVQARRAVIDARIATLDDKIVTAEATMREADPEAYARAREDAGKLADAQAALEACTADINRLEQDQAGCVSSNTHFMAEMKAMKERQTSLEAIEGAQCPLCGQPLTTEHRLELLAGITEEGTALANTYRANQTRIEEIKAAIKGLQSARQQHEAEVKRLQGSEKQLEKFKDRQQRAEAAEAERDRCHAERDALRADLDAGGYSASLTAEIAALQAERDGLGYDDSSHKDARRRLTEFEKFDLDHQRLMQAEAALPGAQRAFADAQEMQTMRQGEVENEQTALTAAQERARELQALGEEFQKRKLAADDLRRKEQTANNARIIARQELDTLDKQRARRDELTAQQDEQREQRGIYEELAAAFGKNGLPAMLIETAIPEIETDANDLLRRMTGGRMTVRINTQREKVAGGAIETLEFLVADELGERAYETFSGGEAFRVNFALRVSMSQLLARRAGAQLSALFLDEGFGTQDEEGRARLVEAINVVQDRFSLILVITHIEELRDSFPVHLQVSKTDEGSRVIIR
jgi:exonuclease SbcC